MKEHILGIDVSKDQLDVVLLLGEKTSYQVFVNTPVGFSRLKNWLVARGAGKIHACLEATGQYGDGVAEALYKQGHIVSVVNPARIKRYGESKLHRNKNDKADAALIAEFCAKERPPAWAPPPPEIKELRQLVRRLEDVCSQRQQERNRLHSGIRQASVIEDIQAHLAFLEQHIQRLGHDIQALIEAYPQLKQQQLLLKTIPGIGKLTAARLIAEIGDISAFDSADQLDAFAGLNPKGSRSGSSVFHKAHISREGRSFLRSILYMPAIVAWRCNPIVRRFCQRLLSRGLPKMAIVAAAMRKLLHLVFGILKHQMPFDPNFLSPPVLAS